MSSSNCRTSTIKDKHIDKKKGGKTKDCSLKEVALGDIIWVKSHHVSWWPAQVTDEDAVSKSKKPKKNSSSEVLVRIYGSYIYKYVNPVKCRSKFKEILDQNNGSYSSILEKNVEKFMAHSQSGSRKRKVSNSKDSKTQTSKKLKPNNSSPSTVMAHNQSGSRKRKVSNSKDNKTQTKETPKKLKPNNLSPSTGNSLTEKSQDLIARRIKIMQTIGLMAPSGSPFNKA